MRIGDAPSHTWMGTGIGQGRVFSPLLFNFFVNNRCCPGVRLVPTSDVRFVASSLRTTWPSRVAYFQQIMSAKHDVVTNSGSHVEIQFWCQSRKVGMIFEVTLSTYRYLGVILTLALSWSTHVSHLTIRGFGLFAQSTTWSRKQRSPCLFRTA